MTPRMAEAARAYAPGHDDRPDPAARLDAATDRLTAWLFDAALPLQAARLRDPAGGFFERLAPGGEALHLERRARVSARQVYAFAAAARLGWPGDAEVLLDHALEFLVTHHITTDGDVIPTVPRPSVPGVPQLSLYDVAFTLFALAEAKRHRPLDRTVEGVAERVLNRLTSQALHPEAGFEDGEILRSNPHMHLLEAAIQWAGIADRPERWRHLAREIVALCRQRFIDAGTGAVRELFNHDWEPLFSQIDAPIEPGHQYEWAWLMLRAPDAGAEEAAASARLIAIGEEKGRGRMSGLVINGLSGALVPVETLSRLWPQTECIKALALMAERSGGADPAALARVAEAVDGLMRFFDHPVRGSWWEHLDETGAPLTEPARTSSLYHIIGAVEALAALRAQLAGSATKAPRSSARAQ